MTSHCVMTGQTHNEVPASLVQATPTNDISVKTKTNKQTQGATANAKLSL